MLTETGTLLMHIVQRFVSSKPNPVRNFNFVPKHSPPNEKDVRALQSFVDEHQKIFVLTGAGVSTESGIPDYRSEDVGLFATSTHKPIKIQEFLSSSLARRRYWARNFFAWPRFSLFKPNIVHKTVHDWELKGKVNCLVTQNVDGLHKKAGSEECIELHGTSHRVVCISCEYQLDRRIFQNVLMDFNASLRLCGGGGGVDSQLIRPDGDISIDDEIQKGFGIPSCPSCGGILKPDIVFFGDNVPKQRVELIYEHLNSSQGLLVLGSSLQTFSAFRYLMTAKQLEKPIAIVTLGHTRADNLAHLKFICRVGEIMPMIIIP